LIDIDDWRDKQIRLHGLIGTDAKATFYYDETNNIRTLYIGDQGLNVAELKVFVLGGVVHRGEPRLLDLLPLRTAMQIQKTAPEIKLEHVAKGSFLDLLRSQRLATFLRWLMDSGLIIHYYDLDPFYWSVVDIVDSLLPGIDNPMLMLHHVWLKSDLSEVLRVDAAATVSLFHRHGYPGLTPEAREPFLRELIQLFDAHSRVIPVPNAGLLRELLRAGLELDELTFIEGDTPHRLIEDFSMFYLTRIAVFNRATHILDMEELIRDRLGTLRITRGGQPATHFRFVDSKAEPGIQLSDVVVGLLGKMHTYLTMTPRDKVAKDRDALAGISIENAELLRDCISRSHDQNIVFLNHVASQYDLQKIDVFLRFLDGPFAS
jgi:hypothetical protein